jgi:dihydropteroate synthase
MAIVNCTPDSFYVPSRAFSPEEAADRALTAEAEGADIVDFGAESTRPGSQYIGEEEELRRLIPALRIFRKRSVLPVSVDTRRAAVARSALDEGADMVNDISGFSDPGLVPLCARRGAAVVLMHMRGTPRTMAAVPSAAPGSGKTAADGLIAEIGSFLRAAAARALAGGIAAEKIILDPGIGFGKSAGENMIILNRLAEIRFADYPLLIGISRKSFIGEITGRAAEDRLAGTVAANAAALFGGAGILRVHDTAAALDLIRIFTALGSRRNGEKG